MSAVFLEVNRVGLREALEGGVALIDVREYAEYAGGPVRGAHGRFDAGIVKAVTALAVAAFLVPMNVSVQPRGLGRS